ncbi:MULTISPECIES: DNA alkylation repair protein [Aquimarina]|uniref:DNA alkylation repair protein n=1 Tax=Aquimarina algiphila TaxID=2047982 RepID=A0A554VMM1_9FLAO|nr:MULTISPECIES: DNA alkylation repair protein [Aquimarina]TSE09553.1 DNA alkylation repair protein [Aquimarina algiphila]
MKEYIQTIESEFKKNGNPTIALDQKAYMRGQFEFFGLKATQRREIQKPFFIKEFLPKKGELHQIVKILWEKPQRDFQHFGQELTLKYVKQFEKEDIELFEFMVIHKSWWDTIDFIATKLIGEYFKMYPEQRDIYIKKWLASNHIWLQRSCLLFQLKYKEKLDPVFLSYVINSLTGTQEFFINKAIGWVLREYSRTNPEWVVEFTNKTELSRLSRKEALRLIKKN